MVRGDLQNVLYFRLIKKNCLFLFTGKWDTKRVNQCVGTDEDFPGRAEWAEPEDRGQCNKWRAERARAVGPRGRLRKQACEGKGICFEKYFNVQEELNNKFYYLMLQW